ncbi:excinuclease ABC subunit UvrC [Ferruginibacter albus]|uniref:excinuclease ABC subunit UvrC n=1 Tax=Ferruginibacter albus TaxID=2875540 RepID=UPI001CC4CD46|nr:excinuclease ABC subunit UvrC [Ferruginibacter albus]UAY51701.1 excinuclease ABC subunit UvrC [Ferruginibacter albus]
MTQSEFSKIASSIPLQPGIYKYFDAAGDLLYVGKAKSLRKRVSSYFSKTFTSYKTHELVQRISSIEFTIVNSEHDAFLLENSLIKQFQPIFNINLKDDKTYPFIVIKKEPFSRVFFTRKKLSDGSTYLGPYTSVVKTKELLDFIKQNIPLRTCKLNLTPTNIAKGKFKVCLEYHLGNCKGPCEGFQTIEDYNEGLQQVKNILKGNLSPVSRHLKDEMQDNIEKLEFEKAEILKKKLLNLQQYAGKSAIVSDYTGTADVFTIRETEDIAYVNYLSINNGTVIQTQTIALQKKLDETAEEILPLAIAQLRETFNSEAKEIILPFAVEYPEEGVFVVVPKGGDKKKLIEISEKNVAYFIEELKRKKLNHLENTNEEDRLKILEELQDYLKLTSLPDHIECFDNSNFQGSYPVSAMVYFKNGLPDKKNYRKFNVKTVTGINDFATMKEVVYRRYKRLKEENQLLPQLVIIDGGKGQLSAAMESIQQLELEGQMTLVGLAKNEEEIFFWGDKESIKLPWDSESLKLIRRIRDEVHRFGITFHRNQRSKGSFKNELEAIKGISKITADSLLKKFKSIKNIQTKSIEELAEVIGVSKATLVYKHFHDSNPV